jgi:Protein of unknown function (DUF3551)
LIQIKPPGEPEDQGRRGWMTTGTKGCIPMRRILVISALAVASALSLTVSTSPASAARYCLQGPSWGYPGNCAFRSFASCRAAASGTTASCGLNPRYAYARQMPSQQPPPPMNNGWNNGWNNNNFGWNNSGWGNPGWNGYGNPNNRGGLVGGSDSGTFKP